VFTWKDGTQYQQYQHIFEKIFANFITCDVDTDIDIMRNINIIDLSCIAMSMLARANLQISSAISELRAMARGVGLIHRLLCSERNKCQVFKQDWRQNNILR
jgi:hypothetical protein